MVSANNFWGALDFLKSGKYMPVLIRELGTVFPHIFEVRVNFL